MRPLILIIASILKDDSEIPELPSDQLIAFQNEGQPIPVACDHGSFIKIARLQTLIVKEQEKAEPPDMEALKQSAQESGRELSEAMAASLAIQEDATSNILMLERLIVEVVRGACPQECERFGVRYVADVSMAIFFSEAPRQRFLD